MIKVFISMSIGLILISHSIKAEQIPFDSTKDVVWSQEMNHLDQIANNKYKVNGDDPWLILALDEQAAENANILKLPLAFNHPTLESNNDDEVEIEIFFRPQITAKGMKFDPMHRLRYALSLGQSGGYALKIPAKLVGRLGEAQRIDLIDCDRCIVSISPPATLVVNEVLTADQSLIVSTTWFDGVEPLNQEGHIIQPDTWQLHQLESVNDILSVTGTDPYLVSPLLHFDIQSVGGVLFEFQLNGKKKAFEDFQVFFATERHRFIERASSIARVPVVDEIVRFAVPIEHLQLPSQELNLLRQVRLDLAQFSGYSEPSDQSTQWKILSTKILSPSEMQQLDEIIPAHTVHNKQLRAGKREIVKGIFNKLGRDKLFLVLYVLLLIGVPLIAWRKVRSFD